MQYLYYWLNLVLNEKRMVKNHRSLEDHHLSTGDVCGQQFGGAFDVLSFAYILIAVCIYVYAYKEIFMFMYTKKFTVYKLYIYNYI